MREQFKIIEANAGTGKTFCLSTRLLSLLASGVPANRIVALTFTKKAAGEIRNRVLQRLAQGTLSDTSANELSLQLGIEIKSRKFYQELLELLVAGNSRITISTIDSFFNQIARLFSSELSLPVNWKLYDQSEYRSLVIETIVFALSNAKSLDSELSILLQLLNEDEIDKSIVQKSFRLISDILGTYKHSNNSHFEIKTQTQLDDVKVSQTLKKLENTAIPQGKSGPLESWKKSIQESIAIFSAKRWEEFLSKGIPNVILQGQNTFYRNEITAEFSEPFLTLIEHAKLNILDSYRKRHLATSKLVEIIWKCFQELKHSKNILTFFDIENALATGEYNHEDLYLRLDSKIDHFLIDEFQDTSTTQWEILEPFINEFVHSPGKSCFIVGDKKQAIYAWRGGESKLFDTVKSSYPNSEIEQLNLSYRSARSIMKNVNRLYANLPNNAYLNDFHEITNKWKLDFFEHQTVKDSTGYVSYHVSEEKDLDITKISEIINSTNQDNNIGILVQKNEHIETIIQKLSTLTPPILASQEGGSFLINSNAVKIILAAIRLLENPTDTEKFFIICCSPLGKSVTTPNIESAINFSNQLFSQLQDLDFGRFIERLVNSLMPEVSYLEQLRLKKVIDLAYIYPGSDYSLFCDTVENTRFSSISEQRIRVMTIHQSKGLEFDVVILPDLNMNLNEKYSPLIKINDGEDLIPYPNQLLRKLSPELELKFKENLQKKVDEGLAVLYVALTRSKQQLFVILKKQKNNQITLNNILLAEFFTADSEQNDFIIGSNA